MLVLACLAWLGSQANAETLIIVSADATVAKASRDDLHDLYLGKRSTLGGYAVSELVVRADGDAHDAFVKNHLGVTASQFKTCWKKMVFTGQGSYPVSCATDADVVERIKKDKNAIGYIDAASPHEGVKTVAIGEPDGGQPKR